MLQHQRVLLTIVMVTSVLAALVWFGRADHALGFAGGAALNGNRVAMIGLAVCLGVIATRWLMDGLNFVFRRQLVYGIFALPILFIFAVACVRYIVPIGLAVQVVRYVVLRLRYARHGGGRAPGLT